MTHPLTPCEKVELKPCPFCGGDAVAGSNFDNDHYVMCGADCDKCGGMVGYMKTEMAAIENWNRRTALASGSGDHAELAKSLRSSKRERHGIYGRVLVNPDGPSAADALEDLLAENAALRASVVKANDGFEEYERRFYLEQERATEAERKLAEAVGLLIQARSWAPTTGPLGDKISAFLGKEAERG